MQFISIDDAKTKIEAWRVDYKQRRPHGSLGHLTPNEGEQWRHSIATVVHASNSGESAFVPTTSEGRPGGRAAHRLSARIHDR
jgi:hypothetical protein